VFSWAASGGAYLAAIPTAIRNLGFVPFSTSVAEWVNQALNDVGNWIDYFQAFFPADKKLDVGRITGNGDPDGSGRGLFITTDGTGTGIEIEPATNDSIRIETTGTGTSTMVSGAAGTASIAAGTASVQVSGPNSSFFFTGGAEPGGNLIRYPYRAAAPLSLTLPVWPGLGGWTYNYFGANANFGDFEENVTLSLFYVNSLNGAAAVDLDIRRSLPGITGNSEASATIYRLTAVTSEWGTTQTVDPDVQIVERLRTSPYTETVLATVNLATPTWSGNVALTPQTNDYYVRMTGSIPNSGLSRTTGLGSLFVTISKTAVE